MQIIWHGQFCFELIINQNKKQGPVNLVIDPIAKKRFRPDILLFTHKPFETQRIKSSPFIITGPGEYEIKGIFIQGINSQSEKEENTIYTITAEQIQLCHLGKLNQDELNEQQVEKIGRTDVLFIKPQETLKVIHQIEPKIIIPMSYEKIDRFLKAMGEKSVEPLNKLSLRSKDLKEEEKMKIIVLKP